MTGWRCLTAFMMGLLFVAAANAADLPLAADGKTAYRIVKPAHPSSVDTYAVGELAACLKQVTGAEFPVVEPESVAKGQCGIFVGLSHATEKALGKDPLARLADQEHVMRSVKGNIYLYGKGMHGNLYAVKDFMETALDWRWYTMFDKPVVPARNPLVLKPFDRKKLFSFAFREVPLWGDPAFAYWNGINMGFERRIAGMRRWKQFVPDGIESLRPNAVFVHGSFGYIPPSPEQGSWREDFKWLPRSDYFKTNPEFFTMAADGQRVSNRQLCFSNPGLRQELTKNILRHIELLGEENIIELSANDSSTGSFCACPDCQKLEKQYQSPGGPIYDYLIQLCNQLKVEHPKVLVKTLAYRRMQTQKPPVLPAGSKFPDNLIVVFPPVEDCFLGDWTRPELQDTYQDLLKWRPLVAHLWIWYYPNPYVCDMMPLGNVERIINDTRLMKKAGCDGVFYEQGPITQTMHGGSFTALQTYLMFKLSQDVNCDTQEAIREFTDDQYGGAGALVRKYLEELEAERKAVKVLPQVSITPLEYDERNFPYLTLENIYRWQTYFDQMTQTAGVDARQMVNVRVLRRGVDLATLLKWFPLARQYPAYFKEYTAHVARIQADQGVRALRKHTLNQLDDFVAIIQGGGQSKPLPGELEKIDKARVRQYVPSNKRNAEDIRRAVPDPDAAFGYAATVDLPDMPFTFGFYQADNKAHGAKCTVSLSEITPGAYRMYKLGGIAVTPDCRVWFSSKSWATNLELGGRLFVPGEDNVYEAYASLKFDGPTFGGKAKEDLVLCDRVVFVRKEVQP